MNALLEYLKIEGCQIILSFVSSINAMLFIHQYPISIYAYCLVEYIYKAVCLHFSMHQHDTLEKLSTHLATSNSYWYICSFVHSL